jgi:hypothetical protein
MKQLSKTLRIALIVAALTVPMGHSATIGFVTTFGKFFDKTGAGLREGGVSIGYFTTALPTAVDLGAMADPWTSLSTSFGYKDVRTLLDSNSALPTFQTGGSWDYSSGGAIGGTLNVPNSPSNVSNAINGNDTLSAFLGGVSGTATQLWALAFNKGNYADRYAGSTQWAVVTANAFGQTLNDWLYPTGSENIQLSQINATGEVLVGIDGVSAGLVGVGASDVVMADLVPEPSTGALIMIGAASLVALRRLRKV